MRVVCFTMLLPISANLIRALVNPALASEFLIVAGGLGAATLLAFLLTRVGRPRIAGAMLLGLAFIVLTSIAYRGGGVRSPAYIGLLSITFFSVWLVGFGGATLLVVASALAGYVMLRAQQAGLLTGAGAALPVEVLWQSILTQMVLSIVLQWALMRQLRQSTAVRLESEERFRATFEQAAVGMCHTGLDGRFLRTNSRFCAITGYSPDELLLRTVADLTYPDDLARDNELRQQLLAGAFPTYTFEKRYLRKDGTITWVNVTASPIRGASGAIVQLLAVVEEITDRKLNEWAVRQLNATLEERIAERTAALSAANERLRAEVEVRRQVEQALRESEARFRRLADNAPDIIYRFECLPMPRLTYISASFETITGYPLAECYANPKFGCLLMHPDDLPLLENFRNNPEAIRGPLEMRWIHRDGAIIWIEQRNVPVYDNVGALIAVEGIARDITARKQSLDALQERDLRYRDLLTNLRQGVVVFQDERIVFCNEALALILGTSVAHLLSCSITELFGLLYVHDRQRLAETMAATMAGGFVVSDEPFRFHRADNGVVRWIHTASSLISYEGRPALLSVLSDITKLKLTEERLRQSEARLKVLLDTGPVVVFSARAEGDYGATFVSDSIRTILGHEPERYTSEPGFWASHIHPEDAPRIFAGMEELFARGSHQHEYRFQHVDGGYRWVENRMTLAHLDGEQTEIIGYLIDITGRKEAEETLRQSRDALRAANLELARAARLKDEFLANMSHELRTPLNTILGRAELLAEEIHGSLSERQRRSVTSIDESGRHLLELINDILDLSKIEANKLELQQELVSVSDLCEAGIRLVAESARKKAITITTDVDPQVMMVEGDPRRLKQILVNLLSNAVKFTPTGGRVGLEVRGNPESGTVVFSIWDTGIGIEGADLPRLFRPFEQLDSRLSRQYEGTGLGLSLVLRLAHLHGGDVAVSSTPGQGSRFNVTLPWHPRDG